MNVRWLFLSFISCREDYALRRLFLSRNFAHKSEKTLTTAKRRNKTLYRADKVLSSRTQYSRSESSHILLKRRVAISIPGNPLSSLLEGPGVKIPMDADLFLDGQAVPQLPPDILVFHKPLSVLSAMIRSTVDTDDFESHDDEDDDEDDDNDRSSFHRDHLGNYLPPLFKKVGMHPVGRLDFDTSGLMLFSKDGQLTQRLLHPKFQVERQYVASVQGPLHLPNQTNALKEQMEIHGVPLFFKDRKDPTTKIETLCFGKILDIWKGHDGSSTNIRLVVQEGKHRMVRRMLAHCGYPVLTLHRERHGIFNLNDLPLGEFRDATEEELSWLQSLLP